MVMIAPEECRTNAKTKAVIDSLISNHELPLKDVMYFNLKQSMSNGGGPACLRLRVTMNDSEIDAMNQNFIFSKKLYNKLKKWIMKHYRDELAPKDLSDPKLYQEIIVALSELSQILKTPDLYSL